MQQPEREGELSSETGAKFQALHDRLTEMERYDDFVHRPLKETAQAIRGDVGLSPDWTLWTGDGWPPPPSGK